MEHPTVNDVMCAVPAYKASMVIAGAYMALNRNYSAATRIAGVVTVASALKNNAGLASTLIVVFGNKEYRKDIKQRGFIKANIKSAKTGLVLIAVTKVVVHAMT